MRLSLFLCLSALWLTSATLYAQSENEADQILGIWLTGSKKAKVEIVKCQDKYCGKIVWLREPRYPDGTVKLDKKNEDESLQKREVIGINILEGFVYDGDLEWEDGEIYDPDNGKTYSCVMNLIPEKNILEVRGYIGISLIGRTEKWIKSSLD
jgi:uncharacterized protein (DUF2147 family)